MKSKNLLFIAVVLVVAAIAYWALADIEREDLGQLTIAQQGGATSYCVYKIVDAWQKNDIPYFNVGDTVCIECCDNSSKVWPPKINGQQICYTNISFTSQDGTAKYDADLLDQKQKYCYSCLKAKGYYTCP